MIVGDYAFRCHEDREIGFRAYLRTAFPEVVLADVARGEDSPQQTRRATLDLFAVHPEIAVYNVAAPAVNNFAESAPELAKNLPLANDGLVRKAPRPTRS